MKRQENEVLNNSLVEDKSFLLDPRPTPQM